MYSTPESSEFSPEKLSLTARIVFKFDFSTICPRPMSELDWLVCPTDSSVAILNFHQAKKSQKMGWQRAGVATWWRGMGDPPEKKTKLFSSGSFQMRRDSRLRDFLFVYWFPVLMLLKSRARSYRGY